jgi:alkanesulfonate monooxygenase SsuD/methylene tetrahydromethanopterin reductase-like flavin-dependent oxidoreductase (luciferase family)
VTANDGVGVVAGVGLRMPSLAELALHADGFDQLASIAVAAERAGFDSLWVTDATTDAIETNQPGVATLEAYAVLGAMAARTRIAGLGVVPVGAGRRAPSMVAKLVAGIDVISHGRAIASMGTDPGSDRESVERLAEELQICRAMLTEDGPTFDGRYHHISKAPNRPRPVRVGGVPLAVVADRPDMALVIGEFADAVVVTGGPTEIVEITRLIADGCERVGRDSRVIEMIWSGRLDSAPEAPRSGRPGSPGERVFDEGAFVLTGGSDREIVHMTALVDAGVNGCIVSMSDINDSAIVARAGDYLRRIMGSSRRSS